MGSLNNYARASCFENLLHTSPAAWTQVWAMWPTGLHTVLSHLDVSGDPRTPPARAGAEESTAHPAQSSCFPLADILGYRLFSIPDP